MPTMKLTEPEQAAVLRMRMTPEQLRAEAAELRNRARATIDSEETQRLGRLSLAARKVAMMLEIRNQIDTELNRADLAEAVAEVQAARESR